MAKPQRNTGTRRYAGPAEPSPFEQARDELFQHIMRCGVVGAESEAVESFRLALSVAAQRTIARALDLLGVTAPEKM